MKLKIAKGCIVIMPVIGTLGLFIFTFVGKIIYGWGLFVIMLLLSGIINQLFFRCPHCGKSIPANATLNQKYCPLCGADLGLIDSPFSYYSKCKKNKNGQYQAYTTVGYLAFIVGTAIVLFIVVALLGFDSVFKGTGRILILAALALGFLIGMMCRCIVGSAAKLDKEHLYYSKIPGRWKCYDISDIKEQAKLHKPFYHVVRGYVMMTSKGVIAIPAATYKGGKEFLQKLTEYINEPMVDIMPEMVASKRSEEGKKAEVEYRAYKDSIKEKGEN